MRKKLILLATAASLICSTAAVSTPAYADTVTVKGNTQVTMYGFVRSVFSWNKQMSNDPDRSNMPMQDATATSSALYQQTYNKTESDANSLWSRIGFAFKNKDANLSGKIEGDFAHSSNFRLRLAYVKHSFDNFYIILGQDWILEEMHPSIDPTPHVVAGFDEDPKRQSQVQIGSKIDMGSANIDIAFAFEYGAKIVVGKEVDRVTMPYPVARAILKFDTSFGSPARFYAWGNIIPTYITIGTLTDKSETSYVFGTGIKIPVSIVTVGANYNYTYGAVGYAGLTSLSPDSWYNVNGSAKATKSNAFNVNATIKPIPSVTVGAEYDWVEFQNDNAFTNNDKPKVDTYLGQVKIKATKYTTLTLEYRHIKAKYFNTIPKINVSDNDFSGDQVFAMCKYAF